MEEGVLVRGAVVVVGGLGGLRGEHLASPLLSRQEGGAKAACCWRAGSPRGNIRGRGARRHPFVKLIPARQQAVIGQAAVAGRVVGRRRLIG